MNDDHDAMIRAAFEELHQEFASRLPARIEALAAAIHAAAAARDDEAARDQARGLAHRLRGSAGSYGFPAISATAERIEEAFIDLKAIPAADPRSSWATILAALVELEHAATEG